MSETLGLCQAAFRSVVTPARRMRYRTTTDHGGPSSRVHFGWLSVGTGTGYGPRIVLVDEGHRRAVRSSSGSQPGSPPGSIMADKSPRQHMSKQAGKSIKEKRAEKHAKADPKNKIEMPPDKKH
jgi:hypothetical protein